MASVDPDKPRITEEEWAKFAGEFMKKLSGPGNVPAAHMAEHAEKFLSFSKATTIVDMGCGPGQVTNAILNKRGAQLPADAKIIAADHSEAMLQQFNGRKQQEIANGNAGWARVQTQQVDIHDCIGLEDDSVSHMLAGLTVFLVPEPEKAVASMKRVLIPGGVLSLSSWVTTEWSDLMYYPLKVRPDLDMPEVPEAWMSPELIRENLEKAGYEDVEVSTIDVYLDFENHRDTCKFILTKFPLGARAVGQMTKEEVDRTLEIMVVDLKAKYPTVPAKMSGKCAVAYGRK